MAELIALAGVLAKIGNHFLKHPGQLAAMVLMAVAVLLLVQYVSRQRRIQKEKEPIIPVSELITWTAQPPQSAMSGDYHIVTFAEPGFAMLNVAKSVTVHTSAIPQMRRWSPKK